MARTLGVLWLCLCVTRTAALEATATAAPKPRLRQPELESVLLASVATNAGTTAVVDKSVVTPVGLIEVEVAPQSRRRRLEELFKRPSSSQIAINVFLWWTLNVVFGLCNKQCLNSWPHPWALACSHLAIGTLCMLPLYIPLPTRSPSGALEWVPTRQVARLTKAELHTLLPVAALLSVGHVTSTLAPAYGTVAFSNIVKTAEPLFTCACSMVLHRSPQPAPPAAPAPYPARRQLVTHPPPRTSAQTGVLDAGVPRAADGGLGRRARLVPRRQLLLLLAHGGDGLQRRLRALLDLRQARHAGAPGEPEP